MLNRRSAIKSIVAAALGLVGSKRRKKKPELFVVETPDGEVSPDCPDFTRYTTFYWTDKDEIKLVKCPAGRWKLRRIVFEKVGD